MKCDKCGNEVDENNKFCTNCGSKLKIKRETTDKNIQKDSNNPIPNPLQTTDLTPQNIETSTSPNVKYREISAEPEKKIEFWNRACNISSYHNTCGGWFFYLQKLCFTKSIWQSLIK